MKESQIRLQDKRQQKELDRKRQELDRVVALHEAKLKQLSEQEDRAKKVI
jgi:regulator of sirC expression with transglutaminase-like and TPR domain